MSIAARLAVLLLLAAAPLVRGVATAQPASRTPGTAFAIIVNRANAVDELSMAELRRIFMLEMQSWPNGRKITLVLREKGQPERREAIRLICGLSEAEYDRHVLFQTFRGSVGWGPRSILSSQAMQRFVFNAPGALGYVGADESAEGVKVLRIDGRLPRDPDYPLRVRTARAESRVR